MPRRSAWHGRPPASADEARRRLLDAARACVERHGYGRAGLADVAVEAGVTRQTVYRYFADADDLFHSAAALASGGFYERLHARAVRRRSLAARLAECLVFAVAEIPRDPHLAALAQSADPFSVHAVLELGFVQAEVLRLARDHERRALGPERLDALAELLVRLLRSYLSDTGPRRSNDALRAFLVPLLERLLVDPRTTRVRGAVT